MVKSEKPLRTSRFYPDALAATDLHHRLLQRCAVRWLSYRNGKPLKLQRLRYTDSSEKTGFFGDFFRLLQLFCFSKLWVQIFRKLLSGSNSFISGVFCGNGDFQWVYHTIPFEVVKFMGEFLGKLRHSLYLQCLPKHRNSAKPLTIPHSVTANHYRRVSRDILTLF